MDEKRKRRGQPPETLPAPSLAASLAREVTPADATQTRHRFLNQIGRLGVATPPALNRLLTSAERRRREEEER